MCYPYQELKFNGNDKIFFIIFMFRSFFHQLGDALFYRCIEKELKGMNSVLDLGCGTNSPVRIINDRKVYKVGVDIFEDCIKISKKNKIHDKYILGSILDVKQKIKNQKFDAVIAIDVIEHLTRKQGYELIKIMKSISNKKVIILTPNVFYIQGEYEGNPYQKHKSGWEYKDFSSRGFDVYGLRGLKYLRGDYATLKYKPWFLWGAISYITELATFRYPKLAYHLFAVYTIKS